MQFIGFQLLVLLKVSLYCKLKVHKHGSVLSKTHFYHRLVLIKENNIFVPTSTKPQA